MSLRNPCGRLITLAARVSRSHAKAHGLPYYCAPKACKGCGGFLRLTKGDCAHCVAAYRKQAYWYNRDHLLLKAKEKRDEQSRDPEYRAANAAKSRAWRKANPGITYRRVSYYEAHNLKAKARGKAYYHSNKEKYHGYRHKRRAIDAEADGFFTDSDIRKIRKAQNGMCAYCDCKRPLHLDHKTPLSRGGSNWPDNLQYLCQSHNLSKHTKTDAEYRAILEGQGFNVRTTE